MRNFCAALLMGVAGLALTADTAEARGCRGGGRFFHRGSGCGVQVFHRGGSCSTCGSRQVSTGHCAACEGLVQGEWMPPAITSNAPIAPIAPGQYQVIRHNGQTYYLVPTTPSSPVPTRP